MKRFMVAYSFRKEDGKNGADVLSVFAKDEDVAERAVLEIIRRAGIERDRVVTLVAREVGEPTWFAIQDGSGLSMYECAGAVTCLE